MKKEKRLTSSVENTRYEVLKMLQENHSISDIAKYRKVSRQSVYKVLATLNKKGLIAKPKRGTYELTEHARKKYGFKKIEIKKCINPQKIVRVRTELTFNGDIRNLRKFLLDNKEYFPKVPIKEKKRDIPLKLRREVFKRADNLCETCGNLGKEIDHIIPYCAGGIHKIENLRLLCLECHSKTFGQIGKIKIIKSNNNKDKQGIFIKN